MTYHYTTQKQIRNAFWQEHPEFQHLRRAKKTQNDYPCDLRMAFVDFVDALERDTHITEALANRATL